MAKKDFSRLRVIFSPEVLSNSRGSGAYDPGNHVLFISRNGMRSEKLGPIEVHELVHAKLWTELRNGNVLAFSGAIKNRDSAFFGQAYGELFGLDEIVATLYSYTHHHQLIWTEYKNGKASTALTKYTPMIEAVRNVEKYAKRLKTMLSILKTALATNITFEPVDDPLEHPLLTDDLNWKHRKSASFDMFVPDGYTESDIRKLKEFVAKSLPMLNQVITKSSKFQNEFRMLERQGDERDLVDGSIETTGLIVHLFSRHFPKELNIIESTVSLSKKLAF